MAVRSREMVRLHGAVLSPAHCSVHNRFAWLHFGKACLLVLTVALAGTVADAVELWGRSSGGCASCNGGADHGSQHGGYAGVTADYAVGGCDDCGARGCSSCRVPRVRCRTCPPSPEKIDCCDGCGGGRTVFGCGWRTWDWLGMWSCGRGCGDKGGCGEIYRGDYASDPPECCDPCDNHGNWVGPAFTSLRSRFNPYRYGGGEVYNPAADFSYSTYPKSFEGEVYEESSEPAVIRSAPRPVSAPSRLVPSSTRRPATPLNSRTQARQNSRNPLR